MKKIIIVSDSFKGTLSSMEICEIAEELIPRYFPNCQICAIPLADGGEGTAEAVISGAGYTAHYCESSGPWGERCRVLWARKGGTAVIEMAAAAGLPMVGERKDPSRTSTFGVGRVMAEAVEQGCREIFLGLGGSATNDGGCGCAAALGVRFFNGAGEEFVPVGETLKDIARIDVSGAKKRLEGVSVKIMSDVKNPLYGEKGAAFVFGPQKGADREMVLALDRGLRHFSRIIEAQLGMDVSAMPGAGAAGGMGGGMRALLGAELYSGIESLLAMTGFDAELSDADLVITGEGRLDSQSMDGKVISGVAEHTARAGKPLIAIVGCTGAGAELAYERGVDAVFVTNRQNLPFEKLRERAAEDYRRVLSDVLSLLKIKE